MGYTFFTIPKLTQAEINLLVEESNTKVREKERQIRLQKLKSKRGK